jgi:NitT/TauT family transport system permease protein
MPPQAEAGRSEHAPSRPRLFTLTARLSSRGFIGIAVAVFAAIALLWWGVTATGLVRPLFLPSPAMVMKRLGDLAAGGQLAADLSVS